MNEFAKGAVGHHGDDVKVREESSHRAENHGSSAEAMTEGRLADNGAE